MVKARKKIKARPSRLYVTKSGRYYIIRKGKRKYIKAPESISQKQLVKINIKNIIGELKPVRKRKPKRKRKIAITKKILPDMISTQPATGVLPRYFYEPNKLGILPKGKDQDVIETIRGLIQTNQKPVIQKEPVITPSVGREPSTPRPSTPRQTVSPRKPPVETIGTKKPQRRTLAFIITSFYNDTGSTNYLDFLEYQQNYPLKKITKTTTLRDYNVDSDSFYKEMERFLQEQAKEETTMEGKGKIDMDGLYDSDIRKINDELFDVEIPVIASDETETLLPMVKPEEDFGFIINTNPSTSDGSGKDGFRPGHWVSVFIDADDCSLEYNDPLVESKFVPKHILSIGKKIINKIGNKEDYFKVKMNYLKNQDDYTNTCGLHAIHFLKQRYDGIPFSKATGYDDYFKKNNIDNSTTGEAVIHQKYKNYI